MNLKKQRTVLKGFNFLNNLVGKNRQNTFSGLIREVLSKISNGKAI